MPQPISFSVPVLLGLFRSRQGIRAWIGDLSAEDGTASRRSLPLAELPLFLYPARQALLADWTCLTGSAPLPVRWAAFWRVFWATLPESSAESPVAMPCRVELPKRPAPTAAHPRAFRGTKYQPPKVAAPKFAFHDWLADDRLLDGFFARHDFSRLPVLDRDGRPRLSGSETPTVARLLAANGEPWPNLPESFRQACFWRLRDGSAATLHRWLALWRGLDAAEDEAIAASLARLCVLDPNATDWPEFALVLTPARRRIWLRCLCQNRPSAVPPPLALIAELDALSAENARFELYCQALLSNLRDGVPAAFSLDGIRLAAALTDQDLRRDELFLSQGRDDTGIVDFAGIIAATGSRYPRETLSLWRDCGTVPVLSAWLRRTRWDALSPRAARDWLTLLRLGCYGWDDQEKRQARARWQTCLPLLEECHAFLLGLPTAWQAKGARLLDIVLENWTRLDTLSAGLRALSPLLARQCRSPFSPDVDGGRLLLILAHDGTPADWHRLSELDDRVWLRLERTGRRENEALLAGGGLEVLMGTLPQFTLSCLATAPQSLLKVAERLGTLRRGRGFQLSRAWKNSVWFDGGWEGLSPEAACRRLWALCRESAIPSPLPRVLRDYLEGRRTLRPGQIARHCAVALGRLDACRLAALDAVIWRALDAPFGIGERSASARHALRMLAFVDDNRRGLRRFIEACRDGREREYLDHPLNRAWFERHPKIDPERWSGQGLSMAMDARAGATLSIETDPLEILMLGSYVGSCLGLGGLCAYSSVACLLDANKRVVYARDGAGRVVGRQLLAIDEEDRLVCFAVYPAGLDAPLLDAFAAFDRRVARALGVEIFRDSDDGFYEIDKLLSRYWWDDGVWAREVEEAADSVQPQ